MLPNTGAFIGPIPDDEKELADRVGWRRGSLSRNKEATTHDE